MTNATSGLDDETLKRAAAVFAQKGYHGTSITDLCAALGLSRSSLYYYIGSKEELLEHMHKAFIDPLLARLNEAVSTATDARHALELFSRVLMESIATEQELVMVFFDQFAPNTNKNSLVESSRAQLTSLLESLIARAQQENHLKAMDTKIAAMAFLGMHNWAVRWYRPTGNLTPDQISSTFMSMLLHGWASN